MEFIDPAKCHRKGWYISTILNKNSIGVHFCTFPHVFRICRIEKWSVIAGDDGIFGFDPCDRSIEFFSKHGRTLVRAATLPWCPDPDIDWTISLDDYSAFERDLEHLIKGLDYWFLDSISMLRLGEYKQDGKFILKPELT